MTQSYPGGEYPSPLPRAPEATPPLMMSNPVLTRGERRRSAHVGWYVGVPVAVVALAAVAFVATQMGQQPSLLSNETTTPTASTTQTTSAPAAMPAPTPAPAPAEVATASPTEAPVAPPPEITPRSTRLHATHRVPLRHAPSASESGADVSATVPTLTPPAETTPAMPAAHAGSAPTITPPPS